MKESNTKTTKPSLTVVDVDSRTITEYEPASSRMVGGNHYMGMAIQPAEFCQKNKLPFLESNVIKRVCRHRNKNKKEDIMKAIHELQLILEWEYGA